MKKCILCVILPALIFISCSGRKLEIVRNGVSDYSIVVPKNASAGDYDAAKELIKYIYKISDAKIPVTFGKAEPGMPEIWIGGPGSKKECAFDISWEDIEPDGIIIKTFGENLIIAGGGEKGVLNAVHTFLEDYLGVRRYSSDVEVIPRKSSITLGKIETKHVPKIPYRLIHMQEAMDSSYASWHKLNTNADRKSDWGMFVHTFDDFVPPDKYFKTHPEYFSEIGGKRVPDFQLCLSNPKVLDIVVKDLQKRIKENPEAKFWSVSQNDDFGPCQCDKCLALDKKYGGPSGTMIHFVNQVASKFPDKTIATLAYQYTRHAPQNIKPADNVLVVLCSIECDRSRPVTETCTSFSQDMVDWSRLTNNIMIWDYVVQFRNMVSPFPNFNVLKPNIKFFENHNCKMIFEQGDGHSKGEFHELRTYIIAKLLWDSDADVDKIIKDFTSGYYEEAGPYILKYIKLMHKAMEKSGEPLLIYGNPWMPMHGYLSPSLMDQYIRLFDKAEEAVKDKPDVLDRVKQARLPLEYAELEQARKYGTGERGYFYKDSSGTWKVRQKMLDKLDMFVTNCNKYGYKSIEEHRYTPERYKEDVMRFLSRNMIDNLALFKPVKIQPEPSPKYPAGGGAALTNGLRGLESYYLHWIGFEGEDMTAIIDLEKETQVSEISAEFLQDIKSWIFMPKRVDYYVSSDGEKFHLAASVKNMIDEKDPDKIIKMFTARFEPEKVRFVKVSAVNIKECPKWHVGEGGKSWIFCDEVEVH
ncbi:DUF4838 domain-containing protein [candidate division KSB1 bacterium]|nr:MAG: DUF4838 domain-containing protein [candidate division KSB1 bacterium]